MHLFTKHTSLVTNKGMTITIFNYHSYMVLTILQCVSSATVHSNDYSHCSFLGSDNGIPKGHAVTNFWVEETGPKEKWNYLGEDFFQLHRWATKNGTNQNHKRRGGETDPDTDKKKCEMGKLQNQDAEWPTSQPHFTNISLYFLWSWKGPICILA